MALPFNIVKKLGMEADPNEFMTIAARHRLDWLEQARDNQLPPPGNWQTWLCMAGRGFGKTRVGAEQAFWDGVTVKNIRFGIIAPTHGDVRDTVFEGESGLLNIIPTALIPRGGYVRTLAELTLTNGAFYKGFSGTEPARLRGPQFHRLWFDEFAACEDNYAGCAEENWDMGMFGLRLGMHPRSYVTSTPRSLDILRRLASEATTVLTHGSTYDNRDNLPKSFYDNIVKYEGTRLGDQEIHAKILDNEDIGIIKRDWFRLIPVGKAPRMQFVLASFDTGMTEQTVEKKDKKNKFRADPTAIQIWGLWIDQYGMAQLAVLNVDGGHWSFPELLTKAREVSRSKWFGKGVDLMLIEDKGSGISLRQSLEQEKIHVHKYNPGRADKLLRLNIVSHVFHKRRVWLFESEGLVRAGKPKTWYEPFLSQVCSFIGEGSIRHDDHVDAATQAVRFFVDAGMLPLTPPTITEKLEANALEAQIYAPRENPYG